MNKISLVCICISCIVCLVIGLVVGFGLGVGDLYKPYEVGFKAVFP